MTEQDAQLKHGIKDQLYPPEVDNFSKNTIFDRFPEKKKEIARTLATAAFLMSVFVLALPAFAQEESSESVVFELAPTAVQTPTLSSITNYIETSSLMALLGLPYAVDVDTTAIDESGDILFTTQSAETNLCEGYLPLETRFDVQVMESDKVFDIDTGRSGSLGILDMGLPSVLDDDFLQTIEGIDDIVKCSVNGESHPCPIFDGNIHAIHTLKDLFFHIPQREIDKIYVDYGGNIPGILDYFHNQGVDIVSSTRGVGPRDTDEYANLYLDFYNKGGLIFQSAGNWVIDPENPENTIDGLARGDHVMAVGGLSPWFTDPMRLYISSSWGGDQIPNKPDIIAPAGGYYKCNPDGSMEAAVGTSRAAPKAASLAFRLSNLRPDLSPSTIVDIMRKTASRNGILPDCPAQASNPNADICKGVGEINFKDAFSLAISLPVEATPTPTNTPTPIYTPKPTQTPTLTLTPTPQITPDVPFNLIYLPSIRNIAPVE